MKNGRFLNSLIPLGLVLLLIAGFLGCKGQESSTDTLDSKKSESDNLDIVLNYDWLHSHEEDEGIDTLYFRHQPFEFKPSRGRIGFKLFENKEMDFWAIGPTDIPEKLKGTWSEKDGVLSFTVVGSEMVAGFNQSYKIIKAEKDLIILLRG